MYEEVLLALGVLIPIVNPISTSFIFNKLTRDDTLQEKRRIVLQSTVTAAVVMFLFLITGSAILSFFGITIYAFRVAGGIYLAIVAFHMLGEGLRHEPDEYHDNPKDIAIIPLAIPLLSGPGAITTVLVLSETLTMIAIGVAILIVCVLSYVILSYSHAIDSALGRTGTNVVEKVLGLIVLVIAVQFVFNGITGYIAVL